MNDNVVSIERETEFNDKDNPVHILGGVVYVFE